MASDACISIRGYRVAAHDGLHPAAWAAALVLAPPATLAAERWRCDLDLHQGDAGSLEFTRAGAGIQGRTVVTRGDNTFEHNVSGEWSGEDVRFRRELSATSYQPFRGVAVADGEEVKMGGRFAAGMNGVWSADCRRLLAAPPERRDPPRLPRVRREPEPVRPERGPVRPVRPAVIAPATGAASSSGACVITGRARGPRANTSRVFFINVYGPDDDEHFRETAPFDAEGRYRVSGLPEGRYRLVIDTRTDIAVVTEPRTRTIDCRGTEAPSQDFDFR